jgi:hypothetical protein
MPDLSDLSDLKSIVEIVEIEGNVPLIYQLFLNAFGNPKMVLINMMANTNRGP